MAVINRLYQQSVSLNLSDHYFYDYKDSQTDYIETIEMKNSYLRMDGDIHVAVSMSSSTHLTLDERCTCVEFFSVLSDNRHVFILITY